MITPQRKLEGIIKQFSSKQLRQIMKNVVAIQLTEGCNSACLDCGLGALPGVRDYIPFETLEQIFTEFKDELEGREWSETPLYFASDPFDYSDGTHDYVDVHKMFKDITGINSCVYTNVPKGKEKEIVRYILNDNCINGDRFIDLISIIDANKKRIEKAIDEEISSFQQVQLKSRYGIRKVAYHINIEGAGHSTWAVSYKWVLLNYDEIANKLKIEDKRSFFINGTGLSAMPSRDYKKFDKPEFSCFSLKTGIGIPRSGEGTLSVVRLLNGDYLAKEAGKVTAKEVFNYFLTKGSDYKYNSRNTVRIRDFTSKDRKERKKLGKRFIGELSREGICDVDGVLITPNGFYNLHDVRPTAEFPLGLKITQIDPNNFNVTELKPRPFYDPLL